MKKERYTVLKNGEEIGKAISIRDVSRIIGCSYDHIYKFKIGNQLSFKKITYTILDKLDN